MITALLLSLKLAAITTVLLLLLGIPFAWLLARREFRGRALVEAMVALPLVLPPTVLGYCVLALAAPQGPLGRIWESVFHGPLAFSFAGMVLASVLYSLPFAVQPLLQSFRALPEHWLDLGRVQGLHGLALWRRIVLPASQRGLLAATGLCFAHTMGEFGAVLMVGGSIPGETRVASIALFEFVETGREHEAAWLSLALLVISLLVLLFVYRPMQAGGGR